MHGLRHHRIQFATTHWSVVLAAGDSASPDSKEALEKLCQTYWYPLYAFVRRRGHGPEDALKLLDQAETSYDRACGATALAFRAMTADRLGQMEKAQADLNAAKETLVKLQDRPFGDLGNLWMDVVHCELAVNEAEQQIRDAGPAAKITGAGGAVTATIPQIGVVVAESDDPGFTANASRIPGVQSVVPNVQIGRPEPVVSQPLDARAALNLQPSVAVLDTGIVTTHPDLAPNLNLALSKSFVPDESVEFVYPNPIGEWFSHASHVAGIIAGADNTIGIVGVAPEAEIVAVKVLSDNLGFGAFSWALQGIVYAADIETDVINMSFGAFGARRGEPGFPAWMVQELATAHNRAVNYAHLHGVTIVAAAGNDAIDRDHDADLIVIPTDVPHVISVSAAGPLGLGPNPAANLDVPAFYSNYGQSRIDLAAPGGNLDFNLLDPVPPSPDPPFCDPIPCFLWDFVFSSTSVPLDEEHMEAGWAFAIGTSMAAPHVAGTAALIIGQHGGRMQPDRVRAILEQTADDLGKPGKDPFYGNGRVNAGKAVR